MVVSLVDNLDQLLKLPYICN